jgi:hypothetical protein
MRPLFIGGALIVLNLILFLRKNKSPAYVMAAINIGLFTTKEDTVTKYLKPDKFKKDQDALEKWRAEQPRLNVQTIPEGINPMRRR